MNLLMIIRKFLDFLETHTKMKSLSTVKEWHLEHCGLAIPEVSHVLGCAKKKKKNAISRNKSRNISPTLFDRKNVSDAFIKLWNKNKYTTICNLICSLHYNNIAILYHAKT